MTKGRKVLHSNVWIHKPKTNERVSAEVIVYYATPDGQNPAQIEIFGEFSQKYQKPTRVISLLNIKAAKCEPAIRTSQPHSCLSCLPRGQSSQKSSDLGTTRLSTPEDMLWPLKISLKSGEELECFLEKKKTCKNLLDKLQFLVLFPHSPIPEEPSHTPIMDSSSSSLCPVDYGADSVWVANVLPEEVGSKIKACGSNILVLRRRNPREASGHLDIIKPTEPDSPAVSWDSDKMRRVGCFGNLVFVEIGRRCEGGPGLLWLHPESNALMETLRRFMDEGDGHPVTNSAPQSHSSGTPLTSPAHSLPSCSPQQSPCQQSPGGHLHTHQLSIKPQLQSDPVFLGHSPSSSTPPPIDLTSHPNRMGSLHTSDPITTRCCINTTSQQRSIPSEPDETQFHLEQDFDYVAKARIQYPDDTDDPGSLDNDPNASLHRTRSYDISEYSVCGSIPRSITTTGGGPAQRIEQYALKVDRRHKVNKNNYVQCNILEHQMHQELPQARNYPESSIPSSSSNNHSFDVSVAKQSTGYDSKLEDFVIPSPQKKDAARDEKCDLSEHTSSSSFNVSVAKQSTGHDSKLEDFVIPSPQEKDAACDEKCDLSEHTSNS